MTGEPNSGPRSSAFNEGWYLSRNPDVAAVVATGAVESGYAHWVNRGQVEGRIAPPGFGGPEEFGEAAYLTVNPDVADAVAAGAYASGQEHYEQAGRAEGRPLGGHDAEATSAITAPGSALFDEAWYLDQNRDVAAAIATGAFPSAYQHWIGNGRAEGRAAPPGFDEDALFDEAFYLASYPAVTEELAAGRAQDAQHHYEAVGRFRGYLPNGFARRPANPAARSRFGGLWTDAGDAMDLVEGRLTTGQVTAEQADLLRHWVRYGYVILPYALPADLVDRAATVLAAAFRGELTGTRFDCPAVSGYSPVPWEPLVRLQPSRALDLHWLSPHVRNLVFAGPVRSFLELVFGRPALASRSHAFLHGFPEEYQRDSVEIPFSAANQSAGCWIALEDVKPGRGGMTYFPGSHTLPDQLFGGVHKSVWEAGRLLSPASLCGAVKERSGQLLQQVRQAGLPAQSFRAGKGEVLIWNANLVHGGVPMSADHPCASVTTYCCPQGIVPLSFERDGGAVRRHGDAGQYSSDTYRE